MTGIAAFTAMRTDPSRHPIDEEIESTFEANPGLREELDEAVRRSRYQAQR